MQITIFIQLNIILLLLFQAVASSSSGMQSGIEQIRQGNISQIFPELPGQIPREVEDKANSYFQRIYNVPPHPTLTICLLYTSDAADE